MFLKSKFFRACVTLSLILCFGIAAVLADTIRLKDGSVIKGKIVGFRDGQFIVSIGDGSRARQMTFFADEVEAVEFDATPLANNAAINNPVKLTSPNTTSNTRPQPNNTTPNSNTGTTTQNNSNVIIVGKGDANKSNTNSQPTTNNTNPTQENTVIKVGNTNSGGNTETPSYTNSTPNNTQTIPVSTNTNTTTTRPKPIQLPKVNVLADNTANGWTNTGWMVKKGQRIRITATKQVSLGNGVYAKPEGIRSLVDTKKLMRDEPTGGLIAVIGDDNNEFIFIGASREFTAQRDGMLFLGVNESNLDDNSGTFEATIEIELSAN